MTKFLGRVWLALLAALMPIASSAANDQLVLTKVGPWTDVTSFSINRHCNHIVMTRRDASGIAMLYETRKSASGWTEAEPIESVNSKVGTAYTVGGVFMSDDENTVYFHANFPDGAGGFDIYSITRTPSGWSEPELMDISTEADETFPTFAPGTEVAYFLRHQVMSDPKVEKREFDKQSIYRVEKDAAGKWRKPQPINIVINTGYMQDVCLASDSRTIYYSIRAERKDAAVAHFADRIGDDIWTLPAALVNDESGVDNYSPQHAGGKLYMIHALNKKRERVGSIVSCEMTDGFPKPTVVENGSVMRLGTQKHVAANMVVYDPTTAKVLGRYQSGKWDGAFGLTMLDKRDYIVDVRAPGYSFASYMPDYTVTAAAKLPQTIELFDTIQLAISVFDSEIFRPLDSKVIAVRATDKSIFRSQPAGNGRYIFSLPLGSDYNIIATSKNFEENKFMFRLEGDIVFSLFERQLPLSPLKNSVKVRIVDSETQQPVNANVIMDNLNREERVAVMANNMSNGEAQLKLRAGDRYDMNVGGIQGYSFHNRTIDLTAFDGQEVLVELIPLRANVSIRLNNILFETASAELMPDSYEELDRAVKLFIENPSLAIEVSAHTDNVGSASYNLKLSEMRAQSVVAYLIENGVSQSQIVSKGYGMTMPLVPNTTDENRAINRRVEFKVVDVQ